MNVFNQYLGHLHLHAACDMNSRSNVDPWSDFNLSNSGPGARGHQDTRKPGDNKKSEQLPFYVSQSQHKTSAEIIEEAKANMSNKGTFPSIR